MQEQPTWEDIKSRGSQPGNLVQRAHGRCVDGKIRRRLWLVSAEPGRATSRLDMARADKTVDEQRDQLRSLDPPPRQRMFLRWLWRR